MIEIVSNDNSKNQIFNITYGQSRSISEMIDILREHFPNVNTAYLPRDVLMPNRGTLSVEKAKKLIGYDPQYPLEKGFIRYINWYKELFKEFPGTGKINLIF